jgi:hypothetical protein
MTFTVGQRVSGKWKLDDGSSKWFPGTVTRVNRRTCTVEFEDGDVEKRKPFAEIRAKRLTAKERKADQERKIRESRMLPSYFKNDFIKSFKFVGDRIVKLRFHDKPSVFVRMADFTS